MKIAYVAGPYRAPNLVSVYDNIQRAREIAIKYWKLGYAVVCPHLNTQFMDGISGSEGFADAHIFLDGDLEIIRRCDTIVMICGWEKSKGAIREHDLAKQLGLEIIYETHQTGRPLPRLSPSQASAGKAAKRQGGA